MRVSFQTTRSPGELPLRVCHCGFCRRHCPRYTSDPTGRVEFETDSTSDLVRYRFGTRTADFLTCAHCSTYLGAVCDIEGATYAVLNVNVLDAANEFQQTPSLLEAEGETTADRLARRVRNWTPARVR